MILFTLRCAQSHEFEAWFRDGDGFEAQQKAGEIACPECGDSSVEKAVMAPRLTRSRQVPALSPAQFRAALIEMRRQVETNCDYVGNRFAEEARRIHYNEAPARNIRGITTPEDAHALLEEGIDVMPLPVPEALKEPLQ